VAVGLMLVLHVLAPGAMGSLKQQFEPNRVKSVNSTTQRAGNYDAVTPDIRRHPALGRGFGSYDGMKYRILDNEYLGLLITVGIGGTAAYLVMFLLPMGSAHALIRDRRRPESPFMLAASAGLASFLVGNALFDVLSFSHITYMIFFLMGLIAVSHRGAVRERAART
jgi:O-antigen ligase